jgi:hypothetical protein
LLAISSKFLQIEVSPSFVACKKGASNIDDMSNNAFIGQNAHSKGKTEMHNGLVLIHLRPFLRKP